MVNDRLYETGLDRLVGKADTRGGNKGYSEKRGEHIKKVLPERGTANKRLLQMRRRPRRVRGRSSESKRMT
jgi:hypothetical protein